MTLSWTFSFFSSRPGKVRSKVVPLKGSIKEPNLPFKSCDDPFLQEPNITWGSGGISSMWRFPVSSTFWTFQNNNTTNFIIISPLILFILPEPLLFLSNSPLWFSHLCPLWFWGEDETSLSCSFAPVKLKYFPPWKSYFFPFSDYKIADLRPNWGGSLTNGATALLPSFKGFSSLNKGLSHQRLNWL